MKINRSFRSFFPRFAAATAILAALFGALGVGVASARGAEPFALDSSAWPDDGFPLVERRDAAALDAVWTALESAEKNAATPIEPFATAVDFQLRRQGASYRGKPLALRGRLLRGVFVPTSGPAADAAESGAGSTADSAEKTGYFDLWILLPDSKRNPVRLLTRRAPKSFVPDARLENSAPYPRDVAYRRETVEALAVYYRTTAFDAGDDFFAAPTLVALDFRAASEKSAADSSAKDQAGRDARPKRRANGAKIAVVCGLVAIWFVVRGAISRKKRRGGANGAAKKSRDLPDSIEPFLVVAFCVGTFSSNPIRADESPTSEPVPVADSAADSAEFWAAALGKDVDDWRRETNGVRPKLAADAARRETALLALDRSARIATPAVLQERFATRPLGAFVATEPEKRPVFAPDAPIRPYCGTLRAVETLPLSARETERFGLRAIFRAVVELDAGEKVVLYAANRPTFSASRRFFDAQSASASDSASAPDGIGERVAALGLAFGREADSATSGAEAESASSVRVALTPRIGWFPVDSALGRLGVDLSTFAAVPVFPLRALETAPDAARKKAVARSLRWTSADRAPFYEALAAAGRGKNFGRASEKTANETEAETIVALFNRPEDNQGRAVRLRGRVRRVNLILVDDPDVRAATGVERYYQLYLFANDSQGRPLVLCVPELPDGLEPGGGEDFRREIEFAGFFYKTWAYRTARATAPRPENAAFSDADSRSASDWARVPLLIGRVVRVDSETDAPSFAPFSPTFLFGTFAVLAVVWVALRRLCYRPLGFSAPPPHNLW